MRLGKAFIEVYTAVDRKTKKQTRSYRVRWRVYQPDRAPVQRKRGGFVRRGQAETFVETLRKAEQKADGWSLDADGFPVAVTVPQDETVLDMLSLYTALKWGPVWKSPGTRSKNRGCLLIVAACLLTNPVDSARLNLDPPMR